MAETPPLDPQIVLWSADEAARTGRPLLVLLHGYGSDERDLFGLTPHLPERFVIASVRAPLAPPWPTPGASWYPIEGLEGRDPDAVTAAAGRVVEWVNAVSPRVPVGLLGFSQGGAVSVQALRVAPERFAFAVNLAGYAAGDVLPGDETLRELKPPVFWGRGTLDEVIPDAAVAHTTEWLPAHSELSGRVYAGLGHAVSAEELDDVRIFLDQRLAELDAPAVG